MRTARGLALTMLALTLTLCAAAPALPLRPPAPKPVDFELTDRPLPADRSARATADASASTRGRSSVLRSRVLRAPKRFNLAGLRWKGAREAELAMRVRRAGASWTRWLKVPVEPDHGPDSRSREGRHGWMTSDPLWAGDADELQYAIRAGKPIRRVHIHFVNSKGTATALDRLRNGVVRAAIRVASTAAAAIGAEAEAQIAQPAIVPREAWGADACRPRATPAYGEVKLAFVHHTVTANDYPPEDSAAIVLGICRYHRNSNGWNDIGYQFLVDRYGKLFEGRAGGIDQAVVGAQAQGYNSQSTGIANLGTFSIEGQTEPGLASLAQLISWKLAVHGEPAGGSVTVRSTGGSLNRYPAGAEVSFQRVSGHRDGDRTACPGDGLYSQLPRLRSMVENDTRASASLTLAAARRNIPYGRKAQLSGSLRGPGGEPLAGGGIELQALHASGSASGLASATTDGVGRYGAGVRVAFNRLVQARFGGNASLRPARSSTISIGVRPRVTATLARAAARIARGDAALLRGSVRPRKRSGLLLVDRLGSDGVWRRVIKRAVRARLGRLAARHRFARAGRYRLRLGVDRDSRNLSARSESIEVQVR